MTNNLFIVEKLKINDIKSNLQREIFKFKHKRDRLIEREINNRERVKKMAMEKEKAIQNQMEINRIVQEQAQQATFG